MLLPSLASLCNAGLHPLLQNVTFELRKDREQFRHRTTGWCREIQGFGLRR